MCVLFQARTGRGSVGAAVAATGGCWHVLVDTAAKQARASPHRVCSLLSATTCALTRQQLPAPGPADTRPAYRLLCRCTAHPPTPAPTHHTEDTPSTHTLRVPPPTWIWVNSPVCKKAVLEKLAGHCLHCHHERLTLLLLATTAAAAAQALCTITHTHRARTEQGRSAATLWRGVGLLPRRQHKQCPYMLLICCCKQRQVQLLPGAAPAAVGSAVAVWAATHNRSAPDALRP